MPSRETLGLEIWEHSLAIKVSKSELKLYLVKDGRTKTVKRQENTHGKAQLEEVENSKLFHKGSASLLPHSILTK